MRWVGILLLLLLLTSCRATTVGGFGQGLSDGLSGTRTPMHISPTQINCYDFGGGMVRCYAFP